MNKELLGAINALEEEYGISKDVMFDTIEKALYEEYKAQYLNNKSDRTVDRTEEAGADESEDNEDTIGVCRVEMDRVTGEFHIYADRKVVEDEDFPSEDEDTGKYVSLTDAKENDAKAKVGDIVTVELEADKFTRTASKAAKNAIIQKIREEQKNSLYNEYIKLKGKLITGIVQRIDENGNVLLDIGKMQTTLRDNKRSGKSEGGETFEIGERIKVVVLSVENKGKGGVQVRVSRSAPEFVKALFTEMVTEIQDGLVEIKAIAREAGSRTKMAVYSNDPDIDAVGSCVGRNGDRVKTIVSKLNNEQIDVINWDENPAQLIVNALSPAKVVSIEAFEDTKQAEDGDKAETVKKAKVVVSDQQLSLAIGKAGQNVRLASRLTEYGIDIKSESQIEEMLNNTQSEETFEEGTVEEENIEE